MTLIDRDTGAARSFVLRGKLTLSGDAALTVVMCAVLLATSSNVVAMPMYELIASTPLFWYTSYSRAANSHPA